jgi:hypothetical protein
VDREDALELLQRPLRVCLVSFRRRTNASLERPSIRLAPVGDGRARLVDDRLELVRFARHSERIVGVRHRLRDA